MRAPPSRSASRVDRPALRDDGDRIAELREHLEHRRVSPSFRSIGLVRVRHAREREQRAASSAASRAPSRAAAPARRPSRRSSSRSRARRRGRGTRGWGARSSCAWRAPPRRRCASRSGCRRHPSFRRPRWPRSDRARSSGRLLVQPLALAADRRLERREEAHPLASGADQSDRARASPARLEDEVEAEPGGVAPHPLEDCDVHLRHPQRLPVVTLGVEEAGDEAPSLASACLSPRAGRGRSGPAARATASPPSASRFRDDAPAVERPDRGLDAEARRGRTRAARAARDRSARRASRPAGIRACRFATRAGSGTFRPRARGRRRSRLGSRRRSPRASTRGARRNVRPGPEPRVRGQRLEPSSQR